MSSDNQMMADSVLGCSGLNKTFAEGGQSLTILNDVNFRVVRGERIAIMGSSGSGKSTLLNLLGGLDQPTSGEVSVVGKLLPNMSEQERCQARNQNLGFVYQFHHLLPEFTALENVCMPLLLGTTSITEARKKARSLLERVGLAHRLQHKPNELSGGERQRVAIARALITEPACVLMDEPTGNLDRKTADAIYQLMLELNRELSISFVVVTHDAALAAHMDKVYELSDGALSLLSDVA